MAITKEERARRDKLAEQGIKACSKCKEEKPFSEFIKNKSKAYGFEGPCKSCSKQYKRQHYQKNKEQYKESRKQHYEENKDWHKEYNKQYRQENKERLSKQRKQYYQENKERVKQYRQENKERIKEKKKQYRQENKERISEYNKQYRQNNKERLKKHLQKPEVRERKNKRLKERRKNDPMFRVRRNIGNAIKNGFNRKGWAKDSSTQEIIGCAWEQLVLWLGGEPSKEMHIDHIIPQSLADTQEELKLLNHYTNLQLLPAEENISKGNRYIRKENLNRVLAHHPHPDKLKEIVKRSNVEII